MRQHITILEARHNMQRTFGTSSQVAATGSSTTVYDNDSPLDAAESAGTPIDVVDSIEHVETTRPDFALAVYSCSLRANGNGI